MCSSATKTSPRLNTHTGLSRRFIQVRGPALAGVVGPILFWGILITLGRTQSGYNAIETDISQLALGANGWVQTANFIVFGALIIAFEGAVQRAIVPDRVWGAINILALGCGFGLLLIAVFPTDRVGTWTIHGAIHLGVVTTLAVLLPLSCLVTAAHLRRDRDWRGYALFSVVVGALTTSLTVVLLLVWAGLWRASHPWLGLYERIAFALPCVWMEVVALRLLRLS